MSKFTLFLMGSKGLACLKAINEKFPANINTVVYANDKNVENDYVDEIIDYCKLNKLNHYDKKSWENYKEEQPAGYAIAVSWRWLIQNKNLELIVLHDSLLPKYRGFNPLVSALINGDEVIGVTALFANKEFDRGDIIDQEAMKVNYPLTIAQAIEEITFCYQSLVLKVVEKLLGNSTKAQKQDESKASYSLWRDNEDYFLDWNLDAPTLRRTVDALGFPYAGAKTFMDDQIITITKAEALPDVIIENRTSGKILFLNNNQPEVVCGKGLLRIVEAFNENKERVEFTKFRQRFK
jgi:methionyl-tRNA formyltransferase